MDWTDFIPWKNIKIGYKLYIISQHFLISAYNSVRSQYIVNTDFTLTFTTFTLHYTTKLLEVT